MSHNNSFISLFDLFQNKILSFSYRYKFICFISCFRILQKIIDDESPPADGEECLAALTAGDRIPWAKARNEFFSKGKNKNSLNTIENVSPLQVNLKMQINYRDMAVYFNCEG